MTREDIIPHIPAINNSARRMLSCLCRHGAVSQTTLMKVGLFDEHIQGPLCAYTAFEFWMLQIDAQLRRVGWRIEELGTGYRVVSNDGVQ